MITLTTLSLLAPTAALASAPCGSADAPSSHSTSACNITVNGVSSDVCVMTTGTKWTCTLSGSFQSSSANATVVEDFASGSFGKYSAWGEITGSNGVPVKFCCIETNTNVEDFELIGTGGTDTLKLNDGTHDLRGARGGLLGALVRGESGDDAIEGSRESSSLYMAEELRGGPGSDTIRGRAGDDRICGGVCGAGSDSADYMSGGPGDDELIGDAGADLMCDTSGADAFYGNDGDDDMYSSSATTPTGDGGAGTNECGDSDLYTAWATSCSDTIATEPGSCPLP